MADSPHLDDTRRALERLHEAQRIGQIGDWGFDLADGVISWSPQVYEIMGLDPTLDPPALADMLELFEPDSAAALRHHIDLAVRTGEAQEYGLVLVRGGQRVHLQARAVPRKDALGQVVSLSGTIQDVTARERAERLVAESEQRLGFALGAAEIGDWDMDLRTNVARRSLRHDQCFGYTSPVPHWGYDTFLSHVDPVDRDRVDAVYQAAMSGRGDYDVEFRVTWPDGSRHWLWSKGRFYFDETGEPYRVAGIQVDVTERRREVEAAIRLAAIVQSSEDAIISQDRAGVVLSWNPGAERLFGHAAAQMIGRGLDLLADSGAPEDEQRWFDLAADGETVAPFESLRRRADGVLIDVVLTLSPLKDKDGRVVGVSTIARDIGERKRLELSLRHLALHDTLTGLPNRALLDDRMQHALTANRSRDNTVSVLFLDLDRFKVLNDAEGHAAGDAVLVEVARRLCAAVRPHDTVARFGGDEFVVLCESGGLTTARLVAERLHASLAQPFLTEGQTRFLAASIGIAVADDDSTAEELLRDADAAMYRAKDLGRGRTAVFDPDIRARAAARLEATTALRRALGAGELRVYYQPVVDLSDESLLGFEALVRWQHPELGLLGPGAFVPEAEESGFVVPLGEWVLDTALEQSRRWAMTWAASTPPHVAVNVSARQLEEPDLAQVVANALTRHAFPAEALTLEITESAVMRDVLRNVENLRALRDTGLELSIDDFGTGYSSLVYLKRLPVTSLKIDREFVDGLGREAHDSAIVTAVVALARALELRVIAEGVETPSQLAELRRLGCDAAQGFFFSPPIPAEEAEQWVRCGRAPQAVRRAQPAPEAR
ncbi:diguanylate phosphodiesterase [Actinotalea ferrariae CF5-4]|uniref:Diguanylate phosphodiesterase n=1 Tax=Actinotalea ferrariae CF5-4 TaxID=948458 RepID=A0A021VYD1_9CELL|nr:EAL domain-containing protein [Actinotalea ferrariae]EYR65015.1 diguanylate phosphodiesterase [Actinotalea ferrariae CF5-4]